MVANFQLVALFHRFIIVSLVLLSLLLSTYVDAKQFFFDVDRYSVKSGLPDSTVFSIARDQQGYLWLGTPNGLSRFNGQTFDNFSAANPQGTEVTSRNNSNIFIDSQQRLWVGTWGQGVFVYDQQLRLKLHLSEQAAESLRLYSNLVQTFFEDAAGNVWIGTNGGGVSVFLRQSNRTQTFMQRDGDSVGLSHNRVWHINQDVDGAIWIATGAGLDRIRNNDFTVEPINALLADDSLLFQERIRRLLITPTGDMWVGTENGICKMTATRDSCSTIAGFNAQNVTDVRITALALGDQSQLWIGTLSGLYLYDINTENFIPLVNGQRLALLPHDDIRDIVYDSNGVLWVASRPSGLIKISFIGDSITGFTEYQDKQGSTADIGRVHALLEDSQQRVWIGSTQGLLRLDPSETTPQMVDPDIGLVIVIIEDAKGDLWVGSNKGLFRKRSRENEFVNLQSLFPDTQSYLVESLLHSSDGLVWIGTSHNGLFVYDGQAIKRVDLSSVWPQFTQAAIAAIAEDRHQFINVAVLGSGVLRFRLDSERRLVFQAGQEGDLSSNNIVDMIRDNENTLWVATDNKLNKLDDISNTFQYFPQDSRIQNLALKKVLADVNNAIWFSTANGIYQLNSQRTQLEHFTSDNGLHADQFVIKSGFASANGDLYFGGTTGFSRIRTASLQPIKVNSKITISHVTVDDIDILFTEQEPKRVHEYSHSTKDISFHFADLNLLSNIAANYSYRLVGHKEEWSSPTEKSTVSYAGLSPGDYEFQVVSTGKGINQEQVATFRFSILAPWWQTPSAIVCYVLLAVLFFSVWNRWRMATLKASNEHLEMEIKKRSEALVNAETQLIESEKNASLTSLVVGVAHEINTPVGIAVTASSLIHDDAQKLLSKFKEHKVTRSDFEKTLSSITEGSALIATNLEKANNLVHSFKNLSTDQISQTKRQIDLKTYLYEVLVNLGPTMQRANVEWQLDCPENIRLETYPGAISQLLTQLTLNAIEHAFSATLSPKITIVVSIQNNTASLRFSDNGCGVSNEIKEKIFKPFFTTRRQAGSVGLGLQIVANIVTIRLGGTISISDNVPSGTTFICEFGLDT
ncbi:two-component regulator propeller domain-containing protein [Alteromonas flava]|uniref:sensor histidine kinase n=1 Tax=Alteromonas flava TaxID=2048003 RepID=UPI000C28A421|nr:two-component regulator propeller domain-containing protein [Alteromonas flava]